MGNTRSNIAGEAFNTQQTAGIVGATLRKVRYWDKTGVVKPSFSPAQGRGSSRLYSYTDLLALKTVAQFREEGVSLQRIRRCVRFLRTRLPDVSRPLGFCQLISVGESLYLAEDEQTLIDTVKRPGQSVFRKLVDIAAIDRQLRHAVRQLARKHVREITIGDFTYQVEIEPDLESGGYVAEVAGLPGCITQGETLEEILTMAEDAIRCWEQARQSLAEEGIVVQRRTKRKKRKRA